MKINTNTLTFRTRTQAALFTREIMGQLSDGHWENASPHDHWLPWSDATVLVGRDVGRTFYARRTKYALASRELLEVVEQRMLAIARLAFAGYDDEQLDLASHLFSCDGFTGLGDWVHEYAAAEASGEKCGDHYTRVVAFAAEHAADVKRIIEDSTLYSSKDLRHDLREMSQAMQINVAHEAQLAEAVQRDRERQALEVDRRVAANTLWC